MRTVPSGIASLVGVQATRAPIWLLEWVLSSGTQYYSSAEAVSYGGHTYTANRVSSLPSLEAAYIDRKTNASGSVEIELDNLADNGSSAFPITVLNGSVSFEDALVKVHCYSPDASDAVNATWWGYVGAAKFSGDKKSATLTCSFFWNALDLPCPALLLPAKGFQSQEAQAKTGEDATETLPIPLLYGAGALRDWPTVYSHWVENGVLKCQFVLSGITSGHPFATGDVSASDLQLFGATPASVVEFYNGSQVAAPTNLTRFPENSAHTLCAFGYAEFPITDQIKDRLDNVRAFDVRAGIQNGRPLAATSLPSENGPLILRDVLTDPVFSIGIPSALFDSTILTSTANYTGTRYQMRYEIDTRMPLSELVQRILGDNHCFITFDDGKLQIRAKRNTESSVATFATCDSGHTARKIHNDYVHCSIKDSSELVNQVTIKYRRKLKNRRIVTLYDPNAQARAGNTYKKPVELTIDSWDIGGLYDETQAQINAAITIREEQNGNLFIAFDVPIWDGLSVSPGDVITVWSPDIVNNASNNLFRVTKQTIDTGGDYLIHFECQVYKTAIYNDDATALGVDLLRGGEDTNAQGRAPDVIPISLIRIDEVSNDTEGQAMVTLRAAFTVPAYDPTADIAAGVFLENKIAEVEIEYRYTDEALNAARYGNSKKIVQQATAFADYIDFTVPFYKSRSVEAFYISIGPNRARVPVGLIPDPTKITTLTGNLSATGITANVVATSSNFNLNEYAQIEKEQVKVLSKTTTSVTFVNDGTNRTPQFSTASIAHPAGTEIAVLKQSYPSLIRSLNTPVFTYPVVTLNSLVNGENGGVRALWADISPDNLEEYGVAWSTDSDAGTNANKLGSALPAWYTADPFSPPSGVTVSRTSKQKHFLINQSLIGPAGTPVYVRLFARNGKRNFSASLSNLLNSAVSTNGGLQPPTDAPSPPYSGYILENVPVITPEGLQARVRWRVYAKADGSKSFDQVGTTSIVSIFQRVATGQARYRVELAVEDTSALWADFMYLFPLGEQLLWAENVARNAGGKVRAIGGYTFYAGGSNTDLSGITGLAISSIAPIDEKNSYLTFGYTEPSTPVLVSYALILRQLSGESSFTKERKIHLLNELGNQTAGAKSFTEIVKHPKNKAAQWKVRLASIDGTFIESAVFNNTSPDLDTGPPNNGTAITITHAAVKNGRTLIVRFTQPTLQMATHQRNTLIIHDNNATGAGRRYFDPVSQTWVATYSDSTTEIDLGKGSVPAMNTPLSALSAGGRTTIYIRIGVYNTFNSGSVTYSSDTGTSIALSGAGVEPATGDSAAPSGLTAPDVQESFGNLLCSFAKPTLNANTIKRYQSVLSTQATAPATVPTVGLEGVLRIKEGQAVVYRNKQGAATTLYVYYRVENDSGFSTSWSPATSVTGTTISRPLADFIGNGVPALPCGLERNTTSGNGHGPSSFVLDAGANTATSYYVGMVLNVPALSAVDAVRNIVAYDGTTKIATVDTPFSSTPPNGTAFEIHRGLTLAGKSGVGNTLARFILPNSASAVDNFYNGKTLYIPSAASGQQIQKIISYVGSLRRCVIEQLESALTVVPADGCGFMMNDGSFGYASSNLTGIIAPVPFRVWYNDETIQNFVEPIMPTGENSFSLEEYHVQAIRASNGAVRVDEKRAVATATNLPFPALSYTPAIRVQFANLYREGGSDGYSAYSYYSPGYKSSPAGVTAVYNPGTYVPVSVDIHDDGNYPASRYGAY